MVVQSIKELVLRCCEFELKTESAVSDETVHFWGVLRAGSLSIKLDIKISTSTSNYIPTRFHLSPLITTVTTYIHFRQSKNSCSRSV